VLPVAVSDVVSFAEVVGEGLVEGDVVLFDASAGTSEFSDGLPQPVRRTATASIEKNRFIWKFFLIRVERL